MVLNRQTLQPLKRWSKKIELVSVTAVKRLDDSERAGFPKQAFYCIGDNEVVEDEGVKFALEPKLFGKWSYQDVQTSDVSLASYLQVKTTKMQVFVPYTAGRY